MMKLCYYTGDTIAFESNFTECEAHIMKLTAGGQARIPMNVREHLSLNALDEIDFVIRDKDVILIKKIDTRKLFQKHMENMRGKGRIKMTTDEIMRLTRGAK
jgi:bifunctional DNA-binding transcriptional regulator/antitoxin component of YhaV-PrlF toxin-antitoxin module